MSRQILAWEVTAPTTVARLQDTSPDYEQHLEDWIAQDPDILDNDFLVIDRQVPTAYGGFLDLLGLNAEGDIVVCELKRQRTPREVTAQVLEYAAWAARLSFDEIMEIAMRRSGSEESFRQAFRDRFESELPETLNQRQHILIVATEISDAVAAVVQFLAESYGVPINAIALSMIEVAGRKVLLRQTIVSDEQASAPLATKRRQLPTVESRLQLADENGVGEIAQYLWSLHSSFLAPTRYRGGWGFRLRTARPPTKYLSIFNVLPTAQDQRGAVTIALASVNMPLLFDKSPVEVEQFVDRIGQRFGPMRPGLWPGWVRFALHSLEEAVDFVRELALFTGLNLATAMPATASTNG